MLKRHDLLFYLEGGRSYSGELKAPKTGLLHAALQARAPRLGRSCRRRSPTTSCSRITSWRTRRRSAGSGRSARELAEMVRYAVGYQSRAFVTFGAPIALDGLRPGFAPRRAGARAPDRATRSAALYKVLPTALVAAAMRPSITRRDLEARAERVIDDAARRRRPTSASRPGARRRGRRPSRSRRAASSSSSAAAFRVRDRNVLRYYARTIEHLLAGRDARPARTDARARLEGVLPRARRQPER